MLPLVYAYFSLSVKSDQVPLDHTKMYESAICIPLTRDLRFIIHLVLGLAPGA
jgi:hypothetical protein